MSLLASDSDRYGELKSLDETKQGVKGLVDSGLTQLPRIFHHPPESLSDLNLRINHPIPVTMMDRLLDAVRCFNEAPAPEKVPYYSRDKGNGVSFFSNGDLFVSKAACKRDSLYVNFGSNKPDLHLIPQICREVIAEWNREMVNLGELLMGLLSEGLGLKEMPCLEPRSMVANYYPQCPEPDRTFGISSHPDAGMLTVLLQDQVGGLQMMTNDEYKSVDHRVLANPFKETRISVAVFFYPTLGDGIYGPLLELVSEQKLHFIGTSLKMKSGRGFFQRGWMASL